ncbi:GntR family transcriptional regulator [Ottowia thiooxydans]|uniref:GntR family transcriptional regulator n=1 Tax=Ottowia thiooxydans TaxID=219182 RepID=UPI00040ADA54|nr:GntR family transcriptional regulator [Ottowia thiooxydans]
MATKKTPDEYGLLKSMILRGEVMPNERLVEADYALRLGTNRANIRKALARLEQDGLVVSEPFKGTHVRRITEAEAIEIFQVRGALEAMMVPFTVEKMTAAHRVTLKALAQHMRVALSHDDALAVGRASRAVREQMWQISEHSTGTRVLSMLNSQLVRVWFQAIMMPGRASSIVSELEAVVDAVVAGSTDAAVSAIRKYHESSITALKKAIANRSASG